MPSLYLVPEPEISARPGVIPDAYARALALDTTQSFIVEAPAGSGKTALLIQRFLKLLADPAVEDPAQVLAITFTRKATAELLDRVVAQLTSAASSTEPANDFDRATRPLAESVLARDAQLGWALLDNPSRLNIRTIDSISGEIASALPILSGSARAHSPSDDPTGLYAEASRRTLLLLGGPDAALNDALTTLLLHRDGNLANCELLIGSMLHTREQWGELVPLSRPELDGRYLDEVILPRLDRALDLAICRALTRLTKLLPSSILDQLCALAAQMGSLDGYKGAPSPIAICSGNRRPPAEKAAHLDHWRALIHLLVKPSKPRSWRRGFTGNYIRFEILKHHQTQLKEIVGRLSEVPGLLEALCEISSLPPAEYPRETWAITKALFHVLARALAELQLVFAERGLCDFAEVHLLARTALRNDSALDGLSAASGTRLQHLLVDEMQDTSTSQYEFIQLLTRSWDGHSQTVFLVGDPKQSIYLFRQARVERFVRMLASATLGDLPLTPLRLTANFRSRPALVRAFNDDFARIFPSELDPSEPEQVTFQRVNATRTGIGERIWHAAILPSGDPEAIRTQAVAHAGQMRDLIATWRARPLPEGRTEPWSIAILVRSRTHLGSIVAALREGTPIPFRAVEIEPLAERPEILDLLALTRALLHPADRTAWLALLRSPVCGLSLADLHRLAGDGSDLAEQTIFALINSRGHELSEDGISRLEPFWRVLTNALKQRASLTLSQSVERTWRTFGADSFASSDALANAETFFQLLDRLETTRGTLNLARLEENVAQLYAAASTDPDAIDLMTIHKAKGLEWDFVLVPELHRGGRNNSQDLLSFLETNPEDLCDDKIAAGIFAPIAAYGQDAANLSIWMRSIASTRESAERKRLFYVACTRAREELHLFAAPRRKNDGTVSLESDSLLQAAWPAAQSHFESAPIAVILMPQPLALAASAATPASRLIQRIPLDAADSPSQILPLSEVESKRLQPVVRPKGSFSARAFGNAAHAFLEQLASRMAAGASSSALVAELPTWSPRIAAVLRATGLGPADVSRFASDILRSLIRTLNDPEGQWLLAPHPHAASEFSLTARLEEPATIRLDRTFYAGPEPFASGATHLWIVDYKTATHGSGNLAAFLDEERTKYAPQLEAYARHFEGREPTRLALFYPMLPRLIWWSGPEPNAD